MKNPARDPNVIGYCGILVTPSQEYQGFFIHEGAEAAGRAMLDRAKTAATFMPDLTLSRPLNESAEDDASRLTGTLSSAAVKLGRTGHPEVGMVLAALRLHTGRDFFWIMAHEEPEGTTTTLMPLHGAKTPEQARDAFKARPEVLFSDVLRMLEGKKAG